MIDSQHTVVHADTLGGDISFLSMLQRRGKSRVNCNTVTQSRAKGGLGLLSIEEQYRAIAGNLMVWTLGPEEHPLRKILRSHLQELSHRRWGFPDLTWVVSQGGSSESCGSSAWRNICKAWSCLKPFLVQSKPRNSEERCSLPLWHPHVQRIEAAKVKCNTQVQHRLRAAGIISLGDILLPDGHFKDWETLDLNIHDIEGHRAYQVIIVNTRGIQLERT